MEDENHSSVNMTNIHTYVYVLIVVLTIATVQVVMQKNKYAGNLNIFAFNYLLKISFLQCVSAPFLSLN